MMEHIFRHIGTVSLVYGKSECHLGWIMFSERVTVQVSCSSNDTLRFTVKQHEHHLICFTVLDASTNNINKRLPPTKLLQVVCHVHGGWYYLNCYPFGEHDSPQMAFGFLCDISSTIVWSFCAISKLKYKSNVNNQHYYSVLHLTFDV
jgi:hypothetical protein